MIKNTKEYGKRYFLVLIGILINIPFSMLGNYLTSKGIPVFLDTIGTVLTTILGGLIPGILVGLIGNIINCITRPLAIYYSMVSVLIAVFAYFFSKRLVFKSWWRPIILVLVFAAIGGILGSVLNYSLFGYFYNPELIGNFATIIHEHGIKSIFLSQITADFLLDIVDKFVVVLICWLFINLMPKKVIAWFPRAHIFEMSFKEAKENRAAYISRFTGHKSYKKISIRKKIIIAFTFCAVVLGFTALGIGLLTYVKEINNDYIEYSNEVIDAISKEINPERVTYYYSCSDTSELPTDYYVLKNTISEIKNTFNKTEFIYLERYHDNGSEVLLDIDTAGLLGQPFKTVTKYVKPMQRQVEKLKAGEQIEPFISNEQFGWLLTTSRPIYDASGNYVVSICIDISMEAIASRLITFGVKLASLITVAAVLVAAIIYEYTRACIIQPLNEMSFALDRFVFGEGERNLEDFESIETRGGDEIENLSIAIKKMASDVSKYITDMEHQQEYINKLQENIITSFANMADNRDGQNANHTRRTAKYVYAIANELAKNNHYKDVLTPDYIMNLSLAAPLHDIGKISIPDAILNKPGRLTDEEFEVIKTHTIIGEKILRSSLEGIEDSEFLNIAIKVATYHHEKWNGNGYPKNLKEEEIPLEARIMALADVFDALVSKRCYKRSYSFEAAIEIIESERSSHFDPNVVDAFIRIKDQIHQIMDELKDE